MNNHQVIEYGEDTETDGAHGCPCRQDTGPTRCPSLVFGVDAHHGGPAGVGGMWGDGRKGGRWVAPETEGLILVPEEQASLHLILSTGGQMFHTGAGKTGRILNDIGVARPPARHDDGP